MEKPNLLWETLTYCPRILFTIEATQTGLRKSLSHDMSHFQYFLEAQFGYTNVRDSTFTYCKSLLKSELDDPKLLFYMKQKSNPLSGFVFVPQLKSFDCNT